MSVLVHGMKTQHIARRTEVSLAASQILPRADYLFLTAGTLRTLVGSARRSLGQASFACVDSYALYRSQTVLEASDEHNAKYTKPM